MKHSSIKKYFFKISFMVITVLVYSLMGQALIYAQDEIMVYVSGKNVSFAEQKPLIKENRTLVPIRSTFEAMKANVHWDSSAQQVVAVLKNGQVEVKIKMKSGSRYMLKEVARGNTKQTYLKEMDIPMQIMNGRTLIPLRDVGEAFGYYVQWDQASRTIHFSISGTPEAPSSHDRSIHVTGNLFSLHDQEIAVYTLVNETRSKNGLQPLGLNVELSLVAREKSKDMQSKQYFDHHSPTYGSPFEMMTLFGIQYRVAGENIAAGYVRPVEVMKAWMESPGHRANILNDQFNEIGVGFYKQESDKYKMYWTQMFIESK